MTQHEIMFFIPIISTDGSLFGESKQHKKTALSLENEMYMLYSKAEII